MAKPSTPDADIPGYMSTVHQSQLDVIRWAGVPYTPCLANVFMAFMVLIIWQNWRWIPVALFIHGLLALMTYDDPRRLEKFVRSLRYRQTYRPGIPTRRR